MLAADHIREEIVQSTPLGRLARLEEIVAPALFLASDDASYITGAALTVDGGMAT
jgi:NAD(P)-dependent dehydrogenase (short-subunit alcohol dehydrogenase family)